ncbi:hypothetical protein P7F88_11115 [Vibrio hannami]|nr:hypothetical protein [Vibrio hannami]MDG3086630.1 hypothetical protein [Vibrio hannami]
MKRKTVLFSVCTQKKEEWVITMGGISRLKKINPTHIEWQLVLATAKFVYTMQSGMGAEKSGGCLKAAVCGCPSSPPSSMTGFCFQKRASGLKQVDTPECHFGVFFCFKNSVSVNLKK